MEDIVARRTYRLVILFIIVYAFYIILHGHLSPGGGFAGGMILGLGLILFLLLYSEKVTQKTAQLPINGAILIICIGAITEAAKFILHRGHGPIGRPGGLFSGGIINVVNLGIGLLVAATILSIFYLEEK